ncbi:hypothetical protein LAZ67_17002403, partial [Cordylochernes scorpioides]
MEVEDGPNNGFTVTRGGAAARRHRSTLRGSPTSPKSRIAPSSASDPQGREQCPPQEVKATRANIADAKARQSTSNQDNYIFIEHCPELSPYEYLQAIDKQVGGPNHIIQFNRMNGHVIGLPLPEESRTHSCGKSARLCGGYRLRGCPATLRKSHLHRPYPDQNGGILLQRRPPGGLHSVPRGEETGQPTNSPRHQIQRQISAGLPIFRHQMFKVRAEKTEKFDFQKNTTVENQKYDKDANMPPGKMHANSAAADRTAADSSPYSAVKPVMNWAESVEERDDNGEGFTVVKHKKRHRESGSSGTTAAQTSGAGPRRATTTATRRSPIGMRSPHVQEVKITRAHFADAKARQAFSTQELCVYIEHCPDFSPYQYLRAVDAVVGGPKNIIQLTRINGHVHVELNSRVLAESPSARGRRTSPSLWKTTPLYRHCGHMGASPPSPLCSSSWVNIPMRMAAARLTSTSTMASDWRGCPPAWTSNPKETPCRPSSPSASNARNAASMVIVGPTAQRSPGGTSTQSVRTPLTRSKLLLPPCLSKPVYQRPCPLHQCLQLHQRRHQVPTTIFDKTNQEGLEEENVRRALASTPTLKKQILDLTPAQRIVMSELVEALLQRKLDTIASIDATRRKSLGLCHLLRQHRVDIALVQETNAHHLDGAQDLCLRCCHRTTDAISGSGLACVYAPGVTVSRHRILWPGHIVLAVINVHGQEMTVINVHLSHDQRERIEQLRVIEAAAVEEEAWVLGDFNIREDRNRDSISMAALGALCESSALLDAVSEFDAAHLPTRVAENGDLIESSRLERKLAPASFLEISTSYATAPYYLSDHRMVLHRVGPPAAPSQPRVAAMLRSGLVQEHMNNYLVDIAEEISMHDAPQMWDRWTLFKAGILAEARSLHDPRHHDRDDGYIGRAQRCIRAQLEASSTNADYPSRAPHAPPPPICHHQGRKRRGHRRSRSAAKGLRDLPSPARAAIQRSTRPSSELRPLVSNSEKMIHSTGMRSPRLSDPEQGVLELLGQMVRNVRIENVLITGDFNARSHFLGDRVDSIRGRNLVDLIISQGLEVWNNWGTPTFSTVNGESVIDLTLYKGSGLVRVSWKAEFADGSDHKLISFTAKSSANPVSVERTPRGKSSPWWSDDLEVERKRMRALRRRAQKSSENEREGKWTRYRAELAKYKKRTRKARRDHWRAQCSRTLMDDKYGLPYKLAMEKLRNPMALKLLRKEDGSRTHDLSDTLSHILDVHFGVGHLECEDVLPRNECMDPLFTEREVKRTAFKFGNRKSPCPDGIDNTIVKVLVRRYGALLTRLYNRCLELGRFPRARKAARVALLEKSGKSGATAKDYRPVSLLSCLGKVLDSLLAQRLTRWLESGGHLSSSQHGFRKGRSTTTCLEGILGNMEEGIAKGNWMIAISFDIAGAYDNLNWNMVVNALDEKGCPFNLLTLVRDFLRDRRVSIKVGAVDIHRIVSKGCPQCSCCGPILRENCTRARPGVEKPRVADTIIRKELPAGACMVAYADDNYLIISEKSRRKAEALANESIRRLKGWAELVNLKFNASKTKALSFKSRDVRAKRTGVEYDHNPILRLGDERIQSLVEEEPRQESRNNFRVSAESSGSEDHWGYRTTSTEALLVISSLTPVSLRLEEEKLRQLIWVDRTENDLGIAPEELEWAKDPDKEVNWVPRWKWSVGLPSGKEMEIFTDGSKYGKRTGAGIAIFSDGSVVGRQTLKLRHDELVYSAELVAIREALIWCRRDCLSPKAIYSDCMSALISICLEKEQMAHEVADLLSEMDSPPLPNCTGSQQGEGLWRPCLHTRPQKAPPCNHTRPEECFARLGRSPLEDLAGLKQLPLQAPSSGPGPAPPVVFIGFTVASINARGLATRRRCLNLCHVLRQHRVDIAFVQETNAHHLDGAQDLCLGYNAVVAPPDAILGSGLACVFALGISVSRHRVLWPVHIALVDLDVLGQEMAFINVHLSHYPRERVEQLGVIEVAAVQEEAWVLGDFNVREDRNRDYLSVGALRALHESTALFDAATEFDAAHLPTRVTGHGDRIESSRLDRILVPARFLERTTSYAITFYNLSDHRMVLLRPDASQLWDRWSLIKAGLLAEARSLHIPRHYTCDDNYIGKAQRLIRAQLEASSINADYPSLPDLARLVRHRRPAVTIRNEDGAVFDGPELRRRAYDIFQPRFARAACEPIAGAAFIEGTTIPLDIDENDPLHREDITLAEIATAISRLPSAVILNHCAAICRLPGTESSDPAGLCLQEVDAFHARPLSCRPSQSRQYPGTFNHPAPSSWDLPGEATITKLQARLRRFIWALTARLGFPQA